MRLKAVARLLAVAGLALVLMPLQIVALWLDRPLQRRLPVLFHRLVLVIIGVRVELVGAPDLRRPLLIASNHVSWLDIPVLASVAELSFVAKSEVAQWPAIGLLAKLQRSVFIDRERRRTTREAAAHVARRLSQGDIIVLFAEGTTGDGTRVLPFRSGLIGAAREAMGPETAACFVQPAAMQYRRRHGLPLCRSEAVQLAWIGDAELFPHLTAVLSGGPLDVKVSFGEAVRFGPDADRKALARGLEQSVRGLMRA